MRGQRDGSVRTELSQLAAGMASLQRRMEQLAALHAGGEEAARIARLERVLDFDCVVAHLHGAVARAELAGNPAPHLLVTDLLPPNVYGALIEAIPPAVCFDGRTGQVQEMRVPPRLAPMPSIVTWIFFDEVVRVLSDLLVARLTEPLGAYARAQFPSLPPFRDWDVEITVTEGRLVRRAPGSSGRPAIDRAWDLVSGIVYLARQHDTVEYGSAWHGVTIPFRGNTMLACVGPLDARAYVPIPTGAPAETERYSYEFGIGPSRDGRHRLSALMNGAA